ncbi:F-box protein [Rhizoctonia solani AG-3 Rhs1AP]|uniref:F-box protein n=2 Tax=Rhizoctonia solani AG-3 TaxID=1086053 RepID=A0A074S3D3_9AGAM|nr:F-box protein [Rhizoctonia solani AG-3 Rhs1AP]KEP52075.1 F-box protein [Rhizoctonia solani 123E]
MNPSGLQHSSSMVLPDDVLREILSYLWPVDVSRFARTSKRSLRIADMVLYKRNHIASVKHLASFCQALTTRVSAANALNMVSIDIREPTRFPLAAIAAALLAAPNLTHLAVSFLPPRDSYYIDPTPLLYACSPSIRELVLSTHVPTATLTEFLITHPHLVSLSLANQSPETMVELGGECVPHLTSITAPPALVACLVPERPIAHVVISQPVPREFMADVIESLAASSGPVLSLGLETEQVSLGVMQEITVRLRDLRSLWIKGRFMYRYSLTYSGLLLDMAPLLGRSPQLTSVSLIGWPAIRALPKSPQSHVSVSPSTPSASFTPSPSPPPIVDHSILEEELQVTRTFHTCAKQLREVVFPSGCRWVAKRDDDETPWEPARECHSARVWWVDRELELELAAAREEAYRIEQLEGMRSSRRRSRHSSRYSKPSSESDDELDYARIEFDEDADADGDVDELFDSEQGGMLVIS